MGQVRAFSDNLRSLNLFGELRLVSKHVQSKRSYTFKPKAIALVLFIKLGFLTLARCVFRTYTALSSNIDEYVNIALLIYYTYICVTINTRLTFRTLLIKNSISQCLLFYMQCPV